MFVIAGLGNPGGKYEKTRHNVGFQVLDRLAGKYNIEINKKRHHAFCGTGIMEGTKVLFVKPQTFMNLSGESIGEVVRFYGVDAKTELIVVYDDVSLAPGQIRIRKKGSAGGHNGVKSLIQHLGTQECMRIRIGVGEKPEGYDLADYVLGHFTSEEVKKIKESAVLANEAVRLIVWDETEAAMNRFN